jgi:hypothetical protein
VVQAWGFAFFLTLRVASCMWVGLARLTKAFDLEIDKYEYLSHRSPSDMRPAS